LHALRFNVIKSFFFAVLSLPNTHLYDYGISHRLFFLFFAAIFVSVSAYAATTAAPFSSSLPLLALSILSNGQIKNLADVLDFLEFKPDQISGIRDRADAVTPELLLPTFCAALQKHMPLLWEKVKAERLARQEATLAAAAAAEQAAAELKARRAAKAMLWGNGNKKGDLTGGNSGSVFAFGF